MLGGSLGWPCESGTKEPQQMELGGCCTHPGESKGGLERGQGQHGRKQHIEKRECCIVPE